jgi:hypothetical protein
MTTALDAPATVAPAELPAAAVEASAVAGRPLLVAGTQPGAVVLLLDLDVQGLGDA